ncbi:MAG: uL15m family ribosomal protein [Thermoplasmatales archaeon]
MVKQKTKKYRGSLYGRGKKAGRGKGKRGGSGMAGLGKHRWIWMVKYEPDHYGSHGFVRHAQRREAKAINVGELDRSFNDLVQNGSARVENDRINVNLKEMGYTILLGGGQVGRPFYIKVGRATDRAVEKVRSAGGEVEIDGDKEE